MRPTRVLLTGSALLLLLAPSAEAQERVPYNQRVAFEAPPVALDSSSIELRVVDLVTGKPVPSLVCFYSGRSVVTDTEGGVRVSGLRRTNTWTTVLAGGYEQTSLIFYPGKLGRSYATVRLRASDLQSPTASVTPTCRDARWPV